nr:MAG TPA: hypothetical protein [Caudoviricetes sp.]
MVLLMGSLVLFWILHTIQFRILYYQKFHLLDICRRICNNHMCVHRFSTVHLESGLLSHHPLWFQFL